MFLLALSPKFWCYLSPVFDDSAYDLTVVIDRSYIDACEKWERRRRRINLEENGDRAFLLQQFARNGISWDVSEQTVYPQGNHRRIPSSMIKFIQPGLVRRSLAL